MNSKSILKAFRKADYSTDNRVTYKQAYDLLDTLYQKNATAATIQKKQFDNNVMTDLWEMCVPDDQSTISLFDFAAIIKSAEETLQKHIQDNLRKIQNANMQKERLQLQLQNAKQNHETSKIKDLQSRINIRTIELKKLNEELNARQEDHIMVTIPFKFEQGQISEPQVQQSRRRNVKSKLSTLKSKRISFDRTTQQQEIQYNTQLQILFYVTIGLFLLELLAEFKRFNLLSMISIMAIFAIFAFDYFHAVYNKWVIILMGISIFLDLIWSVVYTNSWWNVRLNTTNCTYSQPYMRTTLILTYLLMILRLIPIFILYRFRNIKNEDQYHVNIFDQYEITLGGAEENPITEIIKSL